MRTFSLTLAAAALMLATTGIAANAQTQAAGVARLHAQVQIATPLHKAACRGFGPYCPPGTTRVCGRWRCFCRPCY